MNTDFSQPLSRRAQLETPPKQVDLGVYPIALPNHGIQQVVPPCQETQPAILLKKK